jgi:tRNA threonylcarbamoyladenosine biosynthesis protein TsaE
LPQDVAKSETVITTSRQETEAWAAELAKTLTRGATVALTGDLGAGKTVIAKGIGRGLGVKDDILSPTFNYVLGYRGDVLFYHADLYRLNDGHDFRALGLDEYFDSDGVFVIEWADRIWDILPESALKIDIEPGKNPDERVIRVTGPE